VRVASTLPPLNPVLARELKQRMRGRHIWLVVTLYLSVLALILRWVYVAAARDDVFGGGSVLNATSAGRAIFQWLLFFMLLLVCFIVPGLTAAAISGERERQTLVSLQITLLRPRSIVAGKLLASLAFVALLLVASLPLVTIPFLVGGVSVPEMAGGLVMVLATAVLLACLALVCSAVMRRTQGATVLAYGLTLALVLGTLAVFGAQQIPRASGAPRPRPWILVLNPFAATADVVQGRSRTLSFESPFEPMATLLRLSENDRLSQVLDGGGGVVSSGGVIVRPGVAVGAGPFAPGFAAPPLPPPPNVIVGGSFQGQVGVGLVSRDQRTRLAGVPFWLVSLGAWLVLATAAFTLAVRRISLPAQREER
jgi:ABC-type transport system involved in multi-copper enzyme maturation permease subunit